MTLTMTNRNAILCSSIAALVFPASVALAQTDAGTLAPEDVAHNAPDYPPFVDRHVADTALWGDTHLPSSWSTDSGMAGGTAGRASLGPQEGPGARC